MSQLQTLQTALDQWIGLDHFLNSQHQRPSYPPYNITKHANNYKITVALAGYKKDELSVTLWNNELTISTNKPTPPSQPEKIEYLHQGIATRSFKLSFNISPDVIVGATSLSDGLLTIDLQREDPAQHPLKRLEITTN